MASTSAWPPRRAAQSGERREAVGLGVGSGLRVRSGFGFGFGLGGGRRAEHGERGDEHGEQLGLRAAEEQAVYLPTSPHISLHLPTSPHITLACAPRKSRSVYTTYAYEPVACAARG